MKNLQKNKTKILLCNALVELLQEKPFEKIKLNEICEKAMVHKTTFYNHFQDKYELLNYIIHEIQKTILTKINDNGDIIKYYLDLAKEYITNIKENAKFYKAILTSNQNGICTSIVYNIFINDVKEKIRLQETDIPINYVSIFYVNAVFSVITEWVSTGMKDTEQDMIHYIEKLITNQRNI